MSGVHRSYARHVVYLLAALTMPSLVACGQSTALVDCGTGEARLVGNDRYCVYSQELIIEGFECPPQMSFHEVPGGAVCSPYGQSDPLPEDLQKPFEPVMETPVCSDPPCDVVMPSPDMSVSFDLGEQMPEGTLYMGQEDMGETTFAAPGFSGDPALLGQPVATSPTMFRRVVRSRSLACVLSDTSVMTCWGRWDNGARSGALRERDELAEFGKGPMPGVGEAVLGTDRLCMRWTQTDQAVSCLRFDEQVWQLDAGILPESTQLSMHHHTGRLGTVCGLSASGQLECEAMTQQSSVLDGLGRMGFLGMTSFARFSVEQVQTSNDEIFACGVTTAGAVLCAATSAQGGASQRVTQDAHIYEEVFVGERGGETVVTARRRTGEVDVWKGRLGFERLQPPTGTFVELYSAFCGLQNDQVVCWDDIATEGEVGTPTLSVLYPEHPRHLDMALDATDGDVHWCAISLDGELTCSPFMP